MKRIRVRYPNGFETEYNEDVANILIKRGSVEAVKPSRKKKTEEDKEEKESEQQNEEADEELTEE